MKKIAISTAVTILILQQLQLATANDNTSTRHDYMPILKGVKQHAQLAGYIATDSGSGPNQSPRFRGNTISINVEDRAIGIFGGRSPIDREFTVYEPQVTTTTKQPVVIFFHGVSGSSEDIARVTRFEEEADKRGWLTGKYLFCNPFICEKSKNKYLHMMISSALQCIRKAIAL